MSAHFAMQFSRISETNCRDEERKFLIQRKRWDCCDCSPLNRIILLSSVFVFAQSTETHKMLQHLKVRRQIRKTGLETIFSTTRTISYLRVSINRYSSETFPTQLVRGNFPLTSASAQIPMYDKLPSNIFFFYGCSLRIILSLKRKRWEINSQRYNSERCD